MWHGLVVEGLGWRKKRLTLIGVLQRSLEGEQEQKQDLRASSLLFCRQRESKNKAAADWDSWVKKLRGKNSSRLSNNLPALGMSEKTASGCGGNQARDAARGRGGSCQRAVSLRETRLSKEEPAWGWISTPGYNSVPLYNSFRLNICVNEALLSVRDPQLFHALPWKGRSQEVSEVTSGGTSPAASPLQQSKQVTSNWEVLNPVQHRLCRRVGCHGFFWKSFCSFGHDCASWRMACSACCWAEDWGLPGFCLFFHECQC